MRSASAALLPLGETSASLLREVVPVPARTVPLGRALGRVAARDVAAERDVPRDRTAARDGWAVSAERVAGASPNLPVVPPLPPAWVEAGAPLPATADAVLAPEDFDGGCVVADVAVLDGVRAPGEDVRAGERLLAAGERLTAARRMALAAAQVAEVEVRVPGLTLIIAGRDGAEPPDFMAAAVAAWVASRGGEVAGVVACHGETAMLAEAMRAAGGDAVLVLGGTGSGRADRSACALARAGRLDAHGLALRPGETAGFGAVSGRPVLLLPGRPEAMLAALLALGGPLVDALSGGRAPPRETAPLLRKVASTIGLAEFVFVRRRAEGVMPLGGAGLPLARLAEADGAVLVPPESEGYRQGARVEFAPVWGFPP